MSLEIERRACASTAVLDLVGRLTAGTGADKLREAIQQAVAGGAKTILLNMTEVVFMDSAGLSAMVVATDLLRNRGGVLRIVNAQGPVRRVLQITRLDRVLACFDDEQSALAGLAL